MSFTISTSAADSKYQVEISPNNIQLNTKRYNLKYRSGDDISSFSVAITDVIYTTGRVVDCQITLHDADTRTTTFEIADALGIDQSYFLENNRFITEGDTEEDPGYVFDRNIAFFRVWMILLLFIRIANWKSKPGLNTVIKKTKNNFMCREAGSGYFQKILREIYSEKVHEYVKRTPANGKL